MNDLNSLLQVFKEIANNLKNSMIKKRIQSYNSDFNYDELVNTINMYINNFNIIIKETNDDDLLHKIEEKANLVLKYTHDSIFDVHSFVNNAIFLMENIPQGKINSNTNQKMYEKSPIEIAREIEDKFYFYLLNNTYTKQSILRNVRLRINGRVRAEYDFAIQDLQKNTIAYVEIKLGKNKQYLKKIIQDVRKKLFFEKNVVFYLVIYLKETQKFVYIQLDNEKEIFLEEFPTYSDLIEDNQYSTLKYGMDWNTFIESVDFRKLANITANVKDTNYAEGEKVRKFLKKYALYLQNKIPELKSYNWKLNQASTQPYWSEDNGFRLSFYKGTSLPESTQINITFWASWHGGIFIKDNEKLIFNNPQLVDKLQKNYPDIKFVKDKLHIMAIKFDNGMPNEEQVINAVKRLLTILNSTNASKLDNNENNVESNENKNANEIVIPSEIQIKKKAELESVLGIESIANILSSVLIKQFDDSGMMIGVFGKWGRGKTHFSEKLWDSLKNKRPNYKRVFFSAWKYQDTKASWAYLYENIFDSYIRDKNEKTFIDNKTWNKIVDNLEEKKKIAKINIRKHTWFPIITFAIFFIIAFVWSFFIDKKPIVNYLISTFGILIIIKFIFFYFQQKPSAVNLYKKYFSKKNFENYLGLQSEIENEIVSLLKTWIPNIIENEKIILFVDDIDRCNIEQVIDIVDGLRVILDNPEIHNRLIIVTAIDETILKQALEHKYKDIQGEEKIDEMYKEYLEKIFIIGLKLNPLNHKEIEEILSTILPENVSLEDENIDKGDDKKLNNDINLSTTHKDKEEDTFMSVEPVDSIDILHSIAEGNIAESDKDNISENFKEINIYERNYLISAVKKLENATPRKIRIFYYKYLIMKQIFNIKIKDNKLDLQWEQAKDEKIMIDLLIHLANGHAVSDFKNEKNEKVFNILAYAAEMVSVI